MVDLPPYYALESGRPANRANHWGARIADHIRLLFTDFLLHRKFLGAENPSARERFIRADALFHRVGNGLLFLGTVVDASSHYIYDYNYGTFYLVFP